MNAMEKKTKKLASENDYVDMFRGASFSPPPRREETQGNFLIRTTDKLRTQNGKSLYAKINKNNPKPPVEGSGSVHNVEKREIEIQDSAIDFNVFLLETGDDKVRGILELSSLHNDVTTKVRTRVVCLFDVSGSMILKCGRTRKESKLAKLKRVAIELVESLEVDEDFFGLVTFGEFSKVAVPLTEVSSDSKASMKSYIEKIEEKVSHYTDLSAGLNTAIDMLYQMDPQYRHLYRHIIMVFSDGEINKGTIEPEALIHETREKIRENKPETGLNSDHWINISCITTGGNVSEAMYLLSKICGNDAYYYVDNRTKNPEINMLIPFMLRKSSVAQCVSLNITLGEGAELDLKSCSQEHIVRKQKDAANDSNVEKIGYYLHDFPSGIQKHFAIGVEIDSSEIGNSESFLTVQLEYLNNEGIIHIVQKNIQYKDILVLTHYTDAMTVDPVLKRLAEQDLRISLQTACRKSADVYRLSQNSSKLSGNPTACLENGKIETKKIKDYYLEKVQSAETREAIEKYELAIQKNLDALMDTLNKSIQGDGHKWTKLKAVSSSIVRETPNVSKLVADSSLLCPLPKVNDGASAQLAALAKKIFDQQEAESFSVNDKASLFGAATSLSSSLSRMLTSTLDRSAASRVRLEQFATEDDKVDDAADSSSDSED